MKIIATTGEENIAMVYVAEMANGELTEFAESLQPNVPRSEKWVLTISTLYGCPVGCRFCDAGSHYQGTLSKNDMICQLDYMILNRFPDRAIPVQKLKVQFARMGEPAFNENVLEVLEELPELYRSPGLLPSLSTIAPKGTDRFFERLLKIKETIHRKRFQLQFSIHTTSMEERDRLIPVEKWDFERIGQYGQAFCREGERKVTLNFALADGMPVDPDVLLSHFAPEKFLIKITPVNPTYQARKHGMCSHILPNQENYEVIDRLRDVGYDVILSIGELAENHIGSNCGQHVTNYLRQKRLVKGAYTYPVHEV